MAVTTVRFAREAPLQAELVARVEARLRERGVPRHGGVRMLGKALFILAGLAASYVWLVFFARTTLEAVVAAFVLSQFVVMVGFGVMHDAGHGAFSNRRWVNRLFARGLDLIGGNQTLWRTKHGVLHHTYTNLEGLDDDLEGGAHLRMHPDQPWRPWHRHQAVYALPLYSLLALHWVLSDFTEYFGGRIGARRVARPKLGDALVFLGFKALWITLAFVVPLWRHSVTHVLPLFFFVILTVGFCLALVFQLAHVVDAVELPTFPASGRVDDEWIVHQLRTTADFGTESRWLTWYTGGLNHQVIHHLFPKICHVRYPLVRDVVETFCREKGLPYHRYPSFGAAVRGHLRQLRALGRERAVVVETSVA